jgi:hypothetical protein
VGPIIRITKRDIIGSSRKELRVGSGKKCAGDRYCCCNKATDGILVRAEGEEGFKVIESQAASADPVREIELAIDSDDHESTASITLEELAIRGKF